MLWVGDCIQLPADVDVSNLDVGDLYPTPVSWTLGDRAIDCWVQSLDGSPLTGSLADAS